MNPRLDMVKTLLHTDSGVGIRYYSCLDIQLFKCRYCGLFVNQQSIMHSLERGIPQLTSRYDIVECTIAFSGFESAKQRWSQNGHSSIDRYEVDFQEVILVRE
jgi:hypothetical protein